MSAACRGRSSYEGSAVIIRLNGRFDQYSHEALRAGFALVRTSATIDLRNATLAAAALGEIMALANRVGVENVELINPDPLMRKILKVTQLDRVLAVHDANTCADRYARSA
jgi:anti-anti-sigma regulatory factor